MWQSKIGWQLCAARVLREQRVLRARLTFVQAAWWRWAFTRAPPKLRLWRCTQPRAAKAIAGVAVVGKMTSITRATAVMWYTLLASGARIAPR